MNYHGLQITAGSQQEIDNARTSADAIKAYRFARKYTNWHTYESDARTVAAIKFLTGYGLVNTNEFNQFRIVKVNLIPLTREDIDSIFAAAEIQSDYIIALYRVAFPFWDDIASVNGHPQISEPTGLYIFERAIAFDKENHPEIFNGGAWMNSGFSTLDSDDIPDWHILPCEFEFKSGTYKA